MSDIKLSIENDYVDKVRSNVKSDLIVITDTKMENILLKHLHKVTKSKSWWAFLSLFITILAVFQTTNFKSFAFLSKYEWHAVFALLLLFSFIFTIITAIWAIIYTKKTSVKYLMDVIKNSDNN